MEKERITQISMYSLILVAIIVQTRIASSFFQLAMWIGIFMISFFISSTHKQYRANEDKAKLVLISIIGYYIFYILLGLLVGFRNSPYSLKLSEIIKNILFFVGLQVLREIVRTKMLTSSKSMWIYGLVTILFILLQLDFNMAIHSFVNLEELLQFVLVEFLPVVIEGIVLSYLSVTGGYLLNLTYTIPNALALILIPIFPDVDWFITTTSRYVLYLILFLFVSYEHLVRVKRGTKKQRRKEHPIKTIPIIIVVLAVVGFVAGLFPYKPVAVMSNSMYPSFSKGYMCIVEQIRDKNQIEQLKVEDVIEYEYNQTFVLHRIIGIEKTKEETMFVTKGDNNPSRDLLLVSQEQVVGIVRYAIPYLGYPSVWFTEFLLANRNL